MSVSNRTPTKLHVRARLGGNTTFEDAMDLAPTEQGALLKYEEGPFTTEPIASLVKSVEVVTAAGCTARLEDGPLTRASTRDPHAPRWTIHLRPEDLPGIRCPAREEKQTKNESLAPTGVINAPTTAW